MARAHDFVFIHLFHGRRDPRENLKDWGENGPVLGPFDWIHTTYLSHLRGGLYDSVEFPQGRGTPPGLRGVFLPSDEDMEINIVDDTIRYDGVYYGDWSIFSGVVAVKQHFNEIQPYDHDKATR